MKPLDLLSLRRQQLADPLKIAHDEKFRTLFKEIVTMASQGRLEEITTLKVGGVSAFKLQGLRKENGKPANDLNDCVRLCSEDQIQLQGFFS